MKIQEKINELIGEKVKHTQELKNIEKQLEELLFISSKELNSLGFIKVRGAKGITYHKNSWYITLVNSDYGRVLISKNREYSDSVGIDISFDSKEEFFKFCYNVGIIYSLDKLTKSNIESLGFYCQGEAKDVMTFSNGNIVLTIRANTIVTITKIDGVYASPRFYGKLNNLIELKNILKFMID